MMRRAPILLAIVAVLALWRPEEAPAQHCQIIYEGPGCETMRCGCGRRDSTGNPYESGTLQRTEPERQPAKPENPYMPKPTPSPDWNSIKIPDVYRPPARSPTPVSPVVLDELSCNAECRFQRALNENGAGQSYGLENSGSGGASQRDAARCAEEERRAQDEIVRIDSNSGEGICNAGRASERIGMIYKNFLLSCPAYDPTGYSMSQVIENIDAARRIQRDSCN